MNNQAAKERQEALLKEVLEATERRKAEEKERRLQAKSKLPASW